MFHSDSFQFTGIAVSKQGRLFINFPRWFPEYLNAVIEVAPDNSIKPFPDEKWNRWDLAPPTALHEQQTELVSDKPLLR